MSAGDNVTRITAIGDVRVHEMPLDDNGHPIQALGFDADETKTLTLVSGTEQEFTALTAGSIYRLSVNISAASGTEHLVEVHPGSAGTHTSTKAMYWQTAQGHLDLALLPGQTTISVKQGSGANMVVHLNRLR